MKFAFRTTITMILLTLVLTTVSLVGVFSYINARYTANDLSAQILEQTSFRIDQQTAQLLRTAAAQDALSARMLESGHLRPEDFPSIVGFWQQVLMANPELTSFYIGLEATGECTGVSRLRQGKVTVWQSNKHPKTGRLEQREYWIKDYPNTPYAFDPTLVAPDIRNRPWYVGARMAHQPIWSETFRFLGLEETQDVYGVTHATPYYRQDGTLEAVVEVDFDLGGLSRFLKSLPVGRTGFAFIVELRADGSRQLIAHPESEILVRAHQTATGERVSELVPINELEDRRVAAFLASVPADLGDATSSVPIAFTHDGIAYIGRYSRLGGTSAPPWLICTVVPESDVLERVQANNRQTILIGVGILVFAAMISLLVSAQVSRPLEYLAREARSIGQLKVEARPVAHSVVLEVDRLALATEEMKRSLRSFQKYVPTDLIRGLLSSGQEARRGGELRTLTVFFCDVANFTTIAEAMAPNDLVKHLGEYLDALSAPILETEGTVDKYIGDAIMAFWGAPTLHPNHALAACTTAVRQQAILRDLRRRWQADGKPALCSRIGVCTGEVVVGNIGSAARLNYTVIGDAVNLASRLEGLNKYYGTEILISESTYLAAQDQVIARPIDWVSVKGKVEAILVYELLGLKKDLGAATEELITLYSRGLFNYRNREWGEAVHCFEQVLKVRTDDQPARQMVERCRGYEAQPPGDDWNGVQRMDAK